MRKYILCGVAIFLFPLVACAIWQVSDPTHGIHTKHLMSNQLNVKRDIPEQWAKNNCCDVDIYKGTVRSNVERAATQYGWYVLWRAPDTDHVLVNTRIAGPNFPATMNKLLGHYPKLRTRYNMQLKTMEVFTVGKGHMPYTK